jgi:hypothetical protein
MIGGFSRRSEKESAGASRVGGVGDSRTLYVSEDILVASWRALRLTADESAEGIVFWTTAAPLYASPVQVVTCLLVPQQRVSAGRYELPADAVREMGRALRARGLVNVAQLHTHPTDWVDHSPWDDAHAFSLRDGALSIIWPRYGRDLPAFETWGVHERQAGQWAWLSVAEAAARVRVLPAGIDLRTSLEWMHEEDDEFDVEPIRDGDHDD